MVSEMNDRVEKPMVTGGERQYCSTGWNATVRIMYAFRLLFRSFHENGDLLRQFTLRKNRIY